MAGLQIDCNRCSHSSCPVKAAIRAHQEAKDRQVAQERAEKVRTEAAKPKKGEAKILSSSHTTPPKDAYATSWIDSE